MVIDKEMSLDIYAFCWWDLCARPLGFEKYYICQKLDYMICLKLSLNIYFLFIFKTLYSRGMLTSVYDNGKKAIQ